MKRTRKRSKMQMRICSAYRYSCYLQSGTDLYREEWALRPEITILVSASQTESLFFRLNLTGEFSLLRIAERGNTPKTDLIQTDGS